MIERAAVAPVCQLVTRRALLAGLVASGPVGVTLVCAPAGSGKTVLVRSWLEFAGLAERAAWVTVEPTERDEQRFWRAVVAELAAVVGSREGVPTVSRLSPSPSFDAAGTVDTLLEELADLTEPATLVIDDLQELVVPDALARIDVLLRRRPQHLRVVLLTRRDPQLAIHRLRLSGEMVEIRDKDMRFSGGETAELLSSAGIVLSERGLQTLLDKTEGWAAGLRLAALSLANHTDPETFVREFSGTERTVSGYLLAEVLDRQPAAVRSLLLCTSVLDRVNGPLADLVTGTSGSEAILRGLEQANAFVVPVDASRSWFRYHQLFRDLLRLELRTNLPEQVPKIHLAAAGWFEGHGMHVEAISHAQAAGEWSRAAEMLWDHAFGLSLDGREATTQALLSGFPPEVVAADPELQAVDAAGQLQRGLPWAAAQRLNGAEQRAAVVPAGRQDRFLLGVAVLRLSVARAQGDFASVRREVAALSVPGAFGAGEPPSADVRALALLNLGIAETWLHQVTDATAHLQEGLDLAHRTGRPYLEVACLGHLAMIANHRSFSSAAERAREAIRLSERHGWASDPVIAMPLAVLGGFLMWTGRFTDATTVLARAHEALGETADPATGLLVHLASGALHAAGGRLDDALADFDAADAMQGKMISRHGFLDQLHSFRVQTELRLGRLAEVRASLDAIHDDQRGTGEWLVALAALHLAEDAPGAALHVLMPVLDDQAAVLHPFTVVNALLLAARAADNQGHTRDRQEYTERALALSEPDRLVLPFAITSSRGLLERVRHRGSGHDALLADILDALREPVTAIAEAPGQPLYDQLSEGESRVLAYLPTNLSAGDIASDLYLSVHTVKTHMRHIYGKLGAHRRSEAVEQARARGLLGTVPRPA